MREGQRQGGRPRGRATERKHQLKRYTPKERRDRGGCLGSEIGVVLFPCSLKVFSRTSDRTLHSLSLARPLTLFRCFSPVVSFECSSLELLRTARSSACCIDLPFAILHGLATSLLLPCLSLSLSLSPLSLALLSFPISRNAIRGGRCDSLTLGLQE